jgi:exodeoxyribonuclease III
VRWDKKGKAWNHANTVATFERLGFVSAYHAFHRLSQGGEQHPTFYWRTRSVDGPTCHIDYVFVPQAGMRHVHSAEVGARDTWIATGLSDHAPLVVDLDRIFGTSASGEARRQPTGG